MGVEYRFAKYHLSCVCPCEIRVALEMAFKWLPQRSEKTNRCIEKVLDAGLQKQLPHAIILFWFSSQVNTAVTGLCF